MKTFLSLIKTIEFWYIVFCLVGATFFLYVIITSNKVPVKEKVCVYDTVKDVRPYSTGGNNPSDKYYTVFLDNEVKTYTNPQKEEIYDYKLPIVGEKYCKNIVDK